MIPFEQAIAHDTVIKEISIDRTNPGERDNIEISFWMEDGSLGVLSFIGIYCAEFTMNFGIIADESVREVYVEMDNEKMRDIKSKWKRMGGDLHDLKCFVLTMNSTNSVLKIYARGFEIKS